MQNNLFIVCCEKQCLNNLQRKVTWANSNEPIFNIGDFWEFRPHTTDFDLCKLWKLKNTVQAYVVLHPGPYNNCWWPTWPHNKNPGFSVRRTWNRFFKKTFLRNAKSPPNRTKPTRKSMILSFKNVNARGINNLQSDAIRSTIWTQNSIKPNSILSLFMWQQFSTFFQCFGVYSRLWFKISYCRKSSIFSIV